MTVENRNGSVNLTLPDQAGFNVHAETSDGNLQNDFDLPVRENDQHSVLQGTVGKGTANIHISTSQGDISLKRSSVAPLPPLPPAPPAITVAPMAPVPPMSPGLPAEARQAIRDANRQVEEAKREARRDVEDAKREAKRAADDAKRQAKQAASDHDD